MKIHKVELDNKKVFVSQRGDNFRVVKPWRNENGSINWFNFLTGGSWLNLILTIGVVLIILGLMWEYNNNIQTLLDCFEVPGRLQSCIEQFGTERIIP